MATITHTFSADIAPMVNELARLDNELKKTKGLAQDTGETIDEGMSEGAASTKDAGMQAKFASQSWKLAGGAIAAGAALAAAGIKKVIDEVLDLSSQLNQLAKQAQEVGSTAEELQVLNGVFELMTRGGVDAARAVNDLNRRVADAREGAGPAADAFRKLGIDVEEFAGMSTLQQLQRIADGMQVVRDKSERAQIATDLLGGSGRKLIPAFNQGSLAIRDAAASIENAGIVSNDAAAQAEALEDAQLLLNQSLTALKDEALVPLIPVLTDVVNGMADMVELAKESQAIEDWGQAMSDAFDSDLIWAVGKLADSLDAVIEPLKWIIDNVSAVDVAMGALESAPIIGNILRFGGLLEEGAGLVRMGFGPEGGTAPGGARGGNPFASAPGSVGRAAGMAGGGGSRGVRDNPVVKEAAAVAEEIVKIKEEQVEEIERIESNAFNRALQRLEMQAEREKQIRQGTFDFAMRAANMLTSVINSAYESEIAAAEGNADKQHQLRVKQFQINKAAAVAEAIINGIAMVVQTAAQNPPPPGLPLIVANAAFAAAQVAAIAAQPPPQKSHIGGMFGFGELQQDEVPIIGLQGEAMLNRRAVNNLGAEAIDRLNKGQGGGGGPMYIVNKYTHKAVDVVMQDSLRNRVGAVSENIRAFNPRVGRHVPSGGR